MKSTLYIKFIIIYIIFGFLSIFTVATLTSGLTSNRMKHYFATSMFEEANVIASDYLPLYFSGEMNQGSVYVQIGAMRSHLNAAIWFTDANGKMILSVSPEGFPDSPEEIHDFNPAEAGAALYQYGNYHGHFSKDVITVITPVLSGYKTKGYLLIHKTLDDMEQLHGSIMQACYITLAVIYLLSFLILLALHFFVYRPLRQVTEAMFPLQLLSV